MEVGHHAGADDMEGLKNKEVENQDDEDREDQPRKNSAKNGRKATGNDLEGTRLGALVWVIRWSRRVRRFRIHIIVSISEHGGRYKPLPRTYGCYT